MTYKSPWVPTGPVEGPVSYRRPRQPMSGAAMITTLLVLLAVVLAVRELVFYHHKGTTVTVCSKERTATSGGGEYRVYTTGKTFVIKDTHAFSQWRTDSADVYGRLHEGRTYHVTYVGYRISLFSSFPNITDFSATALDEQALARCNA